MGDKKRFAFPITLVIGLTGGITIEVKANDYETGIDHVDIIVDGQTNTGIWNSASKRYEYVYDTTCLIPKWVTLKCVAWDKAGNDNPCCDMEFVYWNIKIP